MENCVFFEYIEDVETMDMIQYSLSFGEFFSSKLWDTKIEPYLKTIANDPPDDILYITSAKLCGNLMHCIAMATDINTPTQDIDTRLDLIREIQLVRNLMLWKFQEESNSH